MIDTNVIVAAAIYENHTPGQVFQRMLEKAITNFTSQEILKEVEETFRDLRARIKPDSPVLKLYRQHSEPAIPAERISACTDPDDDKFLECAVAAQAEFIISGDSHLLAMKRFREIRILSPQEFLTELEFRRE